MKALIAEDDTTSRVLLKAMLTKWGYDVTETSDGLEAWEALQRDDAPKLVILDWMMPGMDGAEICRKVRELDRLHPPYIMLLTALGQKEDIVTGLNAGADDYLTKPFDKDELRARIQVGQRVLELQDALHQHIHELQEALEHVRTLQGILPICMHCHKIRNDQKSWQRIESYVEAHSDAQFSHGLCPECLEKYYPELEEE